MLWSFQGASGEVVRALDLKIKGLGLDFHCWSRAAVSWDKRLILYCLLDSIHPTEMC